MRGRRGVRAAVRPDDVFVVSYPRSGVTWVGFMLANALKPDPDEVLTLKDFGTYVPDLNPEYFWGTDVRSRSGTVAGPRLFRIHAPYDPAFRNVVYLIRDPRDVIVSHYHYLRLTEDDFHLTLQQFVEGRAYHWPCAWDEHVAGWLLRTYPYFGGLLVRYEDVHADPHTALERMLLHAGHRVPAERIERAVADSAFDRMQQIEQRHGLAHESRADERTVRKGRVGGWEEELDPEAVAAIERRFAPVLRAAGYAPRDGVR